MIARENRRKATADMKSAHTSIAMPRLITKAQAAAYCGLSTSSFSRWVGAGLLPTALSGTARWDREAIDYALDKASGLSDAGLVNEFDLWKEKRDARSTERSSPSKG